MKKEITKSIVVIGEKKSGKASIITRYCSKKIYDRSEYFEAGFKFISIAHSHQLIKLMVWKEPVRPGFRNLPPNYFSRPVGWLAIFDLSNRESFDYIVLFIREIQKQEIWDKPIYIVGNKSDLVNNRQVLYEEAKILADEINAPYIEVSALYNLNVDIVFNLVVKEMLFDN